MGCFPHARRRLTATSPEQPGSFSESGGAEQGVSTVRFACGIETMPERLGTPP